MKETILLYNINDQKIRRQIMMICIQTGIKIKSVEPASFGLPVGMLAYGRKEDIDNSPAFEGEGFDDPMLVFGGFTSGKLDQFLGLMRKNKIPKIDLKAVLTEHNSVWDSVTLHDELAREHESMK